VEASRFDFVFRLLVNAARVRASVEARLGQFVWIAMCGLVARRQPGTKEHLQMGRDDAERHVNEVLDRIRAHPLIVAAHNRTLPEENATRWIFCAGRESRTFPDVLQQLLAWTRNETIREVLAENLEDELGNGNPDEAHFRHYLHLLDALGIDHERFYEYKPQIGIDLALGLAFNVASSGTEEISIGYMLVNEAMTPVTYEAARSALTHHHPGLKTNFFDLHIASDEHHVAALYHAVDALGKHGSEMLHFGIALGERGMGVLLDEAYGVFDSHQESITIAPHA
jgi:pyrroloquinoline quinone (PQQ) biosynthesis protein C